MNGHPCVSDWMHVNHMNIRAHRGRKRASDAWNWRFRWLCASQHGCWELNSEPLQKHSHSTNTTLVNDEFIFLYLKDKSDILFDGLESNDTWLCLLVFISHQLILKASLIFFLVEIIKPLMIARCIIKKFPPLIQTKKISNSLKLSQIYMNVPLLR